MHSHTRTTTIASMLGLLIAAAAAHPQYARFDRGTDTIAIAGDTNLGMQATLEAWVWPFGSEHGWIYNEHRCAFEDKYFAGGAKQIWAYTFPNGGDDGVLMAPLCFASQQWRHYAYVNDGVEERLYADGQLVVQRPSGVDIGDAVDVTDTHAIGANQRQCGSSFSFVPSFLGLIDSLRVSDEALYSGASFDPPPPGDFALLSSTVLLFDFNEPAGSATITDQGPQGLTGTLGAGTGTPTSPTLGVAAPTVCVGDVSGDRSVGFEDLLIVIAEWGRDGCNGGDLTGDGTIDFVDLVTLFAGWGVCE